MTYRVLIITTEITDANTLKAVLGDARDGPFAIECVGRLDAGLNRLSKGNIDAILVDLTLPDSKGIATFDQVFAAAPRTPILMLSSIEEETLAKIAVERGAQGYLSKGYFGNNLVPQALSSIIRRKAVEEALMKEKARAEIVLNSISDAVICCDLSGNIDYLNVAAETMTGWSHDDAKGLPIGEVFNIINGTSRERDQHPVEEVLKRDEAMGLNANTVLIRRDGSEIAIEDSVSPIHDWNGKLSGVVIVFHDISASLAMSAKMAHMAQHDFLTNLPNRLLLNDRIGQAITLAKREESQLAVLFLDLDNFKQINDSLGHPTGDKILQSVTQRLQDCVRKSDTVSRQGGDEFVILLSQSNDEGAAAATAGKIITALAEPHFVDDCELRVTSSIGISLYPADGCDAEELIKRADMAMYSAKENGRNNYQFFR